MESEKSMGVRVASFNCYLDTAKENLIHRISAQENPTVLLSSAKTKSPSTKPPLISNFTLSKDSQENLTNLRVDSFSYLNKAGDQNFMFKVPGPIPDPTTAFTFSHEIPKEGGEISVFGADKYFNMKLEYQIRPKHDYKNEEPIALPRSGSIVRSKSPSSCSEVSSYMNSQTALLHRNGSQIKQKKAAGRRIFGGFGCQGPCFNKKGVHINEIVSTCGPKPTRIGSERIHHVPINTENLTAKKQLQEAESLEDARNSIEVFGSSQTSVKGDIATNMERKLSMLTWDAIPKGQNLPTSTIGRSTFCDDMASDASSDLFEIENISGSMYPVLRTAEQVGPDDMSSCLSPQSHYAPSEASIQWSVVTASAADYSSVVYDYNDEASVSVAGDVIARNNKMKNGGVKEMQKTNRTGGILGCKSQKSVEVAENVCVKSTNNAKVAKTNNLDDLFEPKKEGSKGRVKAIGTLQLPRSYAMIH